MKTLRKGKRIAALSLSLVMILGLLLLTGPAASGSQGTANITSNRGIGFVYMFSASPGTTAPWGGGFNQEGVNFVEFDVTVDGLYTLELHWPRSDSMWIVDNTRVHFLNPTGNRRPVSIASLTITSGDVTRTAFSNWEFDLERPAGNFWNNFQSVLFGGGGDGQGPGGITVPTEAGVSSIPGYDIHSYSVTDIVGGDSITGGTIGRSQSMGEIKADDILRVNFRVGDPPVPRYGQVTNTTNINQPITAADTTMLRRYIASNNDDAKFGKDTENADFNKDNADVNGDGAINAADVTLLRRYLAATDPSSVILGPRPPRYFIALTYDDGPNNLGGTGPGGQTAGAEVHITRQILDTFLNINRRTAPRVVCGMNGIDPCANAATCVRDAGDSCGTQSRAQGSFYVMGVDGWATPNANALVQRMLREGHAVENHTEIHDISPGRGFCRAHPENLDRATSCCDLYVRFMTNAGGGVDTQQAVDSHTAINNKMRPVEDRVILAANGVIDFYGNSYSSSNPHRTFSFRPPKFSMGHTFGGIERDSGVANNKPWMFGAIDPWDWAGHSAGKMKDFILYGAQADCKPITQQLIDAREGCSERGEATTWCSLRNSAYTGAAEGNADGSVVLLHDGGRAWDRRPTEQLTQIIIPLLQAMDYHIVTVEQMFYYMNAEPQWIPANPTPGQGGGSRVNDRVFRNRGDYATWRATLSSPPRIYRGAGRPDA
jgi:hypothetical protein